RLCGRCPGRANEPRACLRIETTHIGAVAAMHGNAIVPSDVPNNGILRVRLAAAGQPRHQIIDAIDDDLPRCATAGGAMPGCRLGRGLDPGPWLLPTQQMGDLRGGEFTAADGSQKLVQRGKIRMAREFLHAQCALTTVTTQLSLQLGAAVSDIAIEVTRT